MKHIIHVNRQNISMNNKDDGNRPVFTVKTKGVSRARYARGIKINGPSELVYGLKQLSCGARAWIQTNSDVTLIDEMTFKESRSLNK